MSTPENSTNISTTGTDVLDQQVHAPAELATKNVTWHGIKTVTQLELMQRIRSTKWKRTLLFWFIGVGAICVLFSTAIATIGAYDSSTSTGPVIFATNAYFILFMGLLVTPTLSSTAINGDRERGTLAILQASLLSPLEITLGKLLASWIAALSFLLISMPFILWSFAAGDVSVRAVVSSLLTMAFLLLVVCAVSLYVSARSPKTAGSTMSAYGFVALVSVISLILYGLLLSTTGHERNYRSYSGSSYDSITGYPTQCVPTDSSEYITQGDKLWPLLAINPFVLIADVSTPKIAEYDFSNSQDSIMSGVASAVRMSRVINDNINSYDLWCKPNGQLRTYDEYQKAQRTSSLGAPVWPFGLFFYAANGGLAVWRTSKRLQTPYNNLAKGIRIA